MSKKGRGRRKSTRPPRKSRPPVGGRATAAVDALVQSTPPSRLELVQEPTLELSEPSRLELVPGDSSPQVSAAPPSSGTQAVAVADPFRDEPEASTDPDEISIPPIGDVHAEQFFSEGDLGAHLEGEIEDPEDELWSADRELAARRTMPAVVQRRERYIRYVKWAVVGGAVVCLAALGRAAVSRMSSDVDARMTAAARAPEAPVAAPPLKPAPVAAEPAPAPAPVAAEPAPVAAEPAPAPVAAAPAPVAAAPAPAPAKAEAPARDAKTAAAHKSRSRGLLEAGAAGQAVRAGEQAVAADPSDGEAWLILGAAYQELGNVAQARRCYASCLKQGTRGPLAECRAMLR
jgi:hypothetical protein